MKQSVSQKLVVLGASGATGRHVVFTALARGHHITALVRRPDTFAPRAGLTELIWPDVTDSSALRQALPGADAVISALGGVGKGPTTVCTDGIRSAVTAMTSAGVARLIVVSAHGALETHDKSLYSRALWANVGERMRDKEAMEQIVTASGLTWTIVRPPKLSDHAATGKYAAGTDLPIHLWSAIGRADLAAFLIDEAQTARFAHAYPRVTR
ncbi:NAD(P)-dependent oxidoreductase [Symbioplanes lichenis]|uniref:NAD(P)-dependent oxidoreductase n=1 Tax=Symbioplanes lichenis TaxID=1629072 RepID=UPI00273A28A5|nr:NAD(P)H-binding protein [Actinoplanes lichenis]